MSWLVSLFTVPIIGPLLKIVVDGLLSGYKANLAAGNTSEQIAADLAKKELDVQTQELALQTQYRIAEIGHWYEPDKIMGYAAAFYVAKFMVWDAALHYGSTDALKGDSATILMLIITYYFGKRGFENVARIIKRK